MTDELCLKKKIINQIYDKCKNCALAYYDKKDYEGMLGIISAMGSMQYNINLIYADAILEDLLEKCAKQYINLELNGKADRRMVLFYDEFGFDTRGLATIYLKALVDKGYHVIYMTRSYRKDKIHIIENILEKDSKSKLLFLDRGLYKEETEKILGNINKFNVKNVLIYDYPQGIVGSLLGYILSETDIVTFKINLTDHAFWLGANSTDYIVEFRDFGANISAQYRNIEKEKLKKIPFYPEVNQKIEFEGFPFRVDNSKVIFSGGGLYKTISEDMIYYKIVEKILENYSDIIFWYAGNGDSTQLDLLKKKYPKRVYHTDERRDLYQVMCNIYFYLNTYPIAGGLMGQYAVSAGKIPMTLLHDMEGKLLINNAESLKCEYTTVDDFLKQLKLIINDEDYLKELEKNTSNQTIREEEFQNAIENLLERHKGYQDIHFESVEIGDFSKIYLEKFDVKEIEKYLITKRTSSLIEYMKVIEGGDEVMQIVKYQFQQHGDDRGQLVALEEFNDIPFTIRRVYYMYDTGEGVVRGHHAHKNLEQILICIHGSCKVLLDNGKEKKKVFLEKPYEGLYVSNDMWREMYDFSPDAVLMVLASEYYNEEDYIRDYQEFLDFVKEKK